eukprot:scaffold6521_cov83-Phaeocystis_antarctica.AAC.4
MSSPSNPGRTWMNSALTETEGEDTMLNARPASPWTSYCNPSAPTKIGSSPAVEVRGGGCDGGSGGLTGGLAGGAGGEGGGMGGAGGLGGGEGGGGAVADM